MVSGGGALVGINGMGGDRTLSLIPSIESVSTKDLKVCPLDLSFCRLIRVMVASS